MFAFMVSCVSLGLTAGLYCRLTAMLTLLKASLSIAQQRLKMAQDTAYVKGRGLRFGNESMDFWRSQDSRIMYCT